MLTNTAHIALVTFGEGTMKTKTMHHERPAEDDGDRFARGLMYGLGICAVAWLAAAAAVAAIWLA